MKSKSNSLLLAVLWMSALGAGPLTLVYSEEPATPVKTATAEDEDVGDGACGCDDDEPEAAAKPAPAAGSSVKTALTVSQSTQVGVPAGKQEVKVRETLRTRYENGVLVESTHTRTER
jgi:hypothetical protein